MSFDIIDPEERKRIKMVTYGACGVGKTSFASTAADFEKAKDVLFISPDKGEGVAKGKDFDVIRINQFEQLEDVHEFLTYHVRFRDDDKKRKEVHEEYGVRFNKQSYETVVLDSLTELSRYSEDHIVGNKPDTRISEREGMEGWSDWELQKQNMVGVLRSFRDLDVHFIGTATEKREKDETRGEVTVLPNISGSAREFVEEAVDIIGYTLTKDGDNGVEYGMMFESGNKYVCKQRYGLPSIMKDPTFEKVYQHVNS